MFDITVVTILLLASCPCSFIYTPHTYKIASPSTILPFSSTAIHLSASPSYANPTSTLLFLTNSTRFSICVEPQLLFIFVPSGSFAITSVFAPNASNTFFATEDELPFEQSRATVLSLNDLVAIEIRYPMYLFLPIA